MHNNHTKGPWEVKEHFSLAVFAKGKNRAICTGGFQDGKESSFKENRENMKLIAIAPEMYELLEWIRKDPEIPKLVLDEIEKVLKKYKGEE